MQKIIKFTIIVTAVFIMTVESEAMPKSKGRVSGGGGTVVEDSEIVNRSEGTNTAVNRSDVNTGIEAKNSRIKDSKLTNQTRGNISANASTVSTGIKVNNATINNSELSTNTNANINARG